jgi:polygalacturonase
MKFEVISTTPRSITIELDNNTCYRPEEPVTVLLDGEKAGDYDTNVITLKGLTPRTSYTLTVVEKGIASKETEVITSSESVLLNVREFGARGDGTTVDTAYIQAAVNACPEDGTVYLGKGTYLSGPIFLKSNMNFWIDEGAVLKGISDRSAYPILPGMTYCTNEKDEYNLGTWEGNPLDCFASLITGIAVKNVRIFGEGVVDGGAKDADWWQDPKIRRMAWRPRLIFLNRCENILLQGIEACNSPSWTIHPYYCEKVDIVGLKIRNPYDSPNTDGIDPESCGNIRIIGTDISVGDDCIAIKSGKYYMALRHYKKTDMITVRNCLLQNGHGSVTIGSECAGGVENVQVSRCIFDETDRGLRIKTRRGRGKRSVIENIFFENIEMKDVRMPFTVNMFYHCDPDGHSDYCQNKDPLPVDDMTPRINSITARDIRCSGVDVALLTVYGLPESKVSLLDISNIYASYRPEAERTPGVPIMMDGMDKMSGRSIYVRNVKELRLRNINIEGSSDSEPDIEATETVITDNVEYR